MMKHKIAPDEDYTAPPFSEEALAILFADLHAGAMRYVAAWNRWLIFDGSSGSLTKREKRFRLLASAAVKRPAKPTSRVKRKSIASAKTRAAVVSLAGEDSD